MGSIKLSKAKAYRYSKVFKYLVIHEPAAGRKNVYHAYIDSSGEPILIANECPLPFIQGLIQEIEAYAKQTDYVWYGSRTSAQRFMKKFRRHEKQSFPWEAVAAYFSETDFLGVVWAESEDEAFSKALAKFGPCRENLEHGDSICCLTVRRPLLDKEKEYQRHRYD